MADPKRFNSRHRQTVPTEYDDSQQIDGMGTAADIIGNDSPPSYEASVAIGASSAHNARDLHRASAAENTINTAHANGDTSTSSSSPSSSSPIYGHGSRCTRSSSSYQSQAQQQHHYRNNSNNPWNPIPSRARVIIPSDKPYQPPAPMSPTSPQPRPPPHHHHPNQDPATSDIYYPFDQATYDLLQHSPGCCFSTRGGCFFSDTGGCCFSSMGGCCFADHGGCCFADRGGCCFATDGGCCCCSGPAPAPTVGER